MSNKSCYILKALMPLCCLSALAMPLTARAQGAPHPNIVQSFHQEKNAVYFDLSNGDLSNGDLSNGVLRVEPCAENIARITYTNAQKIPDLSNPVILKAACATAPFHVQQSEKVVDVVTSAMKIAVDRYSGAVQFEDLSGNPLLSESSWPFPRTLTPVTTDGLATHRASVWFALTPKERFYGLGQHQDGVLNERNFQFVLSQDNTNISIPFFLSSKGYGVLWNNGSVTNWNNRFQPVLAIQSNVADAVDYFFLYGPQFDSIIAGYRQLTGQANLLPRWAYGYWQSKLAYRSQSELLGVASKYRRLHIPIDNIVLDEGWETLMGSRIFTDKYPDPRAMVDALHKEHIHIMVSVWPLFQPGSSNFDELQKQGDFVIGGVNRVPAYNPGSQLYDPFNPQARKTYWRQIQKSLFDIGFDAFWMDSSEPLDAYGEEHGPLLAGAKTALGNGSRYANLYPLMTTTAVYDGQRGADNRKRVFILSRSAFAGMQRNSAAAWSGDIATNFATLKREIPAGLNYSMTGLPYWTTDIGGFLGGNTTDPAYQEVFVRWFQYGSFCPIFRAHGTRANNENELWSYGPRAQKILTLYDRLRYRLMPYTYTLAGRTTLEGYTPMRALAFDFRTDKNALDINDEFMYGPSLLVAPVTTAGAASRNVYLPAGTDWYDFWTDRHVTGGQDVTRATPLSIMPLYVRAGSILPMGPEEEYTSEHPDAPLDLRIYSGADGDISLYQDDGKTFDYEKKMYARIPIHWADRSRTLTIGARQGSFPGMLKQRTIRVILVKPDNGQGEAQAAADQTIVYTGAPQQVHLPAAAAGSR